MKKCGVTLSDDEIIAILRRISPNQNGIITSTEFSNAILPPK